MKRVQFYLTPSEGKRLIGKAVACLPDVEEALQNHTVVVAAGTTNGPVAYELLKKIGDTEGFSHKDFIRGTTVPPGVSLKPDFIGDVVIEKGKWVRGKTIFDAEPDLGKGDVIMKGANAVNLPDGEAGVLMANPTTGTVMPISAAVYGRRAKLYVPVGVEKRVDARMSDIASILNDPETPGLRLYPLPGEVVTELEAVTILTGADAMLVSAGGVMGAEGGAYFLAEGEEDEIEKLNEIVRELKKEKLFW